MDTLICVYLGSALLAILLTPPVIWLARHMGVLDRPGPRAVHKRPIPRIGGVAIFLSAMTLIGTVLFLDNAVGEAFRTVQKQLTVLLCSATFIFLIGLTDDLRGLPARFKLLAELMAAAALCFAGVRISSIGITNHVVLHLGDWGCFLTLFWVVGITNAVNLSDGLDGLAAGISALTCGTIAAFAVSGNDPVLSVLMLALAGSLSGFLFFNFNPAKVFMGDCGSLFLGFTIAASSVMCVAKSVTIVGLTLPALALSVPIFDTMFAMLRRFLEGRSLFAPDRSHFHHRLLDLGLHQRQAVLMIHLVTLLAAGSGLFMLLREDLGSLVIFGCVLLLITLLFRAVGAVRLSETLVRLREKLVSSREGREETRTFEQLQLCIRQVNGSDEWWRTICQAAEQLGLAWVSLHVTKTSGGTETSIWRRPDAPPEFTHIVTMSFPLNAALDKERVEFEIAVLINRSLESANHRAGLFTRLVDECVARDSPVVSKANGWDTNLRQVGWGPPERPAYASPDEHWQQADTEQGSPPCNASLPR